ncbi:hypothetical protein HGRIS_003247 [Hohenbuehelia grisea]|uniref:Secreted protein n=1 Tax=Hohenbuehelia grisea TaxID=104357 RepID=A0ABR3JMW0_9AGAR
MGLTILCAHWWALTASSALLRRPVPPTRFVSSTIRRYGLSKDPSQTSCHGHQRAAADERLVLKVQEWHLAPHTAYARILGEPRTAPARPGQVSHKLHLPCVGLQPFAFVHCPRRLSQAVPRHNSALR